MSVAVETRIGDDVLSAGELVSPHATAPRLLVLHEIHGVNDEVRRNVHAYGDRGFTAFAPDLFRLLRPGLQFGYDDGDAARAAAGRLSDNAVVADIVSAANVLRERFPAGRSTAVLAFGWSGAFALRAAALGVVDAVVAYYPGALGANVDAVAQVPVPLLFHFAADDPRTPPDLRAAVRGVTAGRNDVEVHVHDHVAHGFANPDRTEFDAVAAAQADRVTLAFLRRVVAR